MKAKHTLAGILATLLITGLCLITVGLLCIATEPAVRQVRITHTDQPAVIMEVLDPSLEPYRVMWQHEIARRFDHAIGILVHGGDPVAGQWIVGAGLGDHRTPAADLVGSFRSRYPDRTTVFISCNTGHLRLGVEGVYYAPSSVWCVPDRALTPDMVKSGLGAGRLGTTTAFDFSFLPDIVVAAPQPSRWEQEPDAVGNIFEFVTD